MAIFSPFVLTILLLAAVWAGWRVQRALPEHHRTRDTVETVRLVLGMLVTFAALVLGLLTSSAKGHFDAHQSNLRAYSVDLISMDQRLREYGPDADPIRAVLRAYTAAAIFDTWPEEPRPAGRFPEHPQVPNPGSIESTSLGAMLLQVDQMIDQLTPVTAVQRQLIPQISARMQTTLQDRWQLVGTAQSTLSWPFMSVMVGWLVLIFAIFGLSSPANGAVYAVIGLAALSLSLALWLVVDFDAPLSGLLKVSSTSLREALMHMDLPPTRVAP
jgi:hypothetical protein